MLVGCWNFFSGLCNLFVVVIFSENVMCEKCGLK